MAAAQAAENMEISETWPDIYDEGYRDGISDKRIPKILDIYLIILMTFAKYFLPVLTLIHSYFSTGVIKKFIPIP